MLHQVYARESLQMAWLVQTMGLWDGMFCGYCTAPKCHGDPILSKMGTKWGPNFESDGDLMGTLASRNGDPKSVFLKID